MNGKLLTYQAAFGMAALSVASFFVTHKESDAQQVKSVDQQTEVAKPQSNAQVCNCDHKEIENLVSAIEKMVEFNNQQSATIDQVRQENMNLASKVDDLNKKVTALEKQKNSVQLPTYTVPQGTVRPASNVTHQSQGSCSSDNCGRSGRRWFNR